MEYDKRVYKFDGNPGEDFRVWQVRTEAALEAKEVLQAIRTDYEKIGGLIKDETKLEMAKARAIIMQGLGLKPMRVVLPVKLNPFRMWQKLSERYDVQNVSAQVQLHSKLARMAYKNQNMAEYISEFEDIFNRLEGMESEVEESIQVAMLLASFGDKNKSLFGHAVATLQSSSTELKWETATSRLLQEYEEQMHSAGKSARVHSSSGSGLALGATGQRSNNTNSSGRKRKETRKCFGCGRVGHLVKNCRDRVKGQSDKGDEEKPSTAHHAVLMLAMSEREDEEVLLDSGASDHMVNCKNLLCNLQDITPRQIVLGDGGAVQCSKKGTLVLKAVLSGGGPNYEHNITLENVLLVPGLQKNLLSCSALCSDGYNIKFNSKKCVVWRDEKMQLEGNSRNGVYVVNCNVIKPYLSTYDECAQESALVASINCRKLWHDRLGHAFGSRISELASKNAVIGLDLKDCSTVYEYCSGCLQGKQHKCIMKTRSVRSTKIGEVIHSDLSEKIQCPSLGGSLYFMTFIDECSGYVIVHFLKKKSDALDAFKRFHKWFERKYDCKIKALYCDGGGEYVGMEDYLKESGIDMPVHPAYCPEMNGIAERMNRTLMESARSMLKLANMPDRFWAEAIAHAADIRNRFICPTGRSKTCYEVLTGVKPRVDHIKVFGGLTSVHVPKEKRKKLDSKNQTGVLLTCYDNKLVKVWIGSTNTATVSRHYKVMENTFPPLTWYGPGTETHEGGVDGLLYSPGESTKRASEVIFTPEDLNKLTHVPEKPSTFGEDSTGDVYRDFQNQNEHVEESSGAITAEDSTPQPGSTETTDHAPTRRSERVRQQTNFFEPGSANLAFIAEVDSDPVTTDMAMRSSDARKWRAAIQEEVKSLLSHEVWTAENAPPSVRPISTRFIYKKKLRDDGTVARYKARLVARGFLQGFASDTYAPVVDFSTLRIILAIAVKREYHIYQMDVKTAYLHAPIDEDVYVTVPPEAEVKVEKGKVLKLMSYSRFSADCVPFGSRAASPTGTCIAGGTVR